MGNWVYTCSCGQRVRWEGTATPRPPCPRCSRRKAASRDPAVREALELGEDTLQKINDLPDKARAWGEDVAETIRGIMETIEQRERVTDRQQGALENMSRAVLNWFHDDEEELEEDEEE